jgi:hypothetical protein
MAGKYFEELTVGLVVQHQPGRTVTETDNLLFTTMTMNFRRTRSSGSGWSTASSPWAWWSGCRLPT